MFFDSVEQIPEMARKTGATLFVVPDEIEVEIPGALILKPEEKASIGIEQIKELIGTLGLRHTSEVFVVIRLADKMSLDATNAFLKTLEEPGDKVHFVLVTSRLSALLPTVRSRVATYYLRVTDDGQIAADDSIKTMAKRLMTAKPADLPELAEEIAKKKDGVRGYALNVVGVAIEMLYKSYYITRKDVFLKKLPKFLTLYENLAQNGHVKLHLIADLL